MYAQCVQRTDARRGAAWSAALLLGLLAGAGEEAPPRPGVPAVSEPLAGFTAPAQTVTLAALTTGRIAEITVAEGAYIPAGAVAVRLDTTVQERRVALAAAQAESTLELQLAEVRLAKARRESERLQSLATSAAITVQELEDAAADLRAAELELEAARFRHAQAQRELALQQALLDELILRAPLSGYVVERRREVGDTVEEREGVLTLVQLDPLEVVLSCPLAVAGALRVGATAVVTPAAGGASRAATVVFVSPVVDAASQTCRVKLHVPNPRADWKAGVRVTVTFERENPATAAGEP